MYKSVFYSDQVLAAIRKNGDTIQGCGKLREDSVKNAEYWMNLSYDELWGLVFDPKLERSWMVQSGGICPSCKDKVIMYNWIIDAKNKPWKLQCPKCGEYFPKNDFEAYYKSGLTKTGKFSYGMADPSLLYNAETGDPNDKFGVDAGFGYIEDGINWRFIPTYLVYGQWKQLILGGIRALSDAYIYTGEKEYARRALILLDRLADFWPEYDYNNQGWMYERFNLSTGYISYSIDGAFEVCCLATAYDSVAKVLYEDPFITEYLTSKPSISQQINVKKSTEDIRRNIEDRIIKDYIAHPVKIHSNYPYTERAIVVGKAILYWWENPEPILEELAEIVRVATLYDGLTGESSPGGYATMGKHAVASLLSFFLQMDPDIVAKIYRKVPSLYDAYRFHIDIHCLDRYYPTLGDDGYFTMPREKYPNNEGVENLVMYKLYEITKDADLLKVLVRDNKGSASRLFDRFMFLDNIEELERKVIEVVEKEGTEIRLGSIKKDTWEIAVLRSGEGPNKRAVWFNFGANKTHHRHGDAMTIGMYYKGADVMADLGYPNVGFGGGWWSKEAAWTMGTISHNVVTRNRRDQGRQKGTMTLWHPDDFIQIARSNAPGIIRDSEKYERTLAWIDVSEEDSYLIDVFRVTGKNGLYEKFTRANVGTLSVNGLRLEKAGLEYPDNVLMKDFQKASPTEEGWFLDLAIDDVLNVFSTREKIHWKYKSFTEGETLYIASSWVPPSMEMLAKGHQGFWMPAIIDAKELETDGTVTFVSVMEPYTEKSNIASCSRIGTGCDRNVVLTTELSDGRTDVVLLLDPDGPQKEASIRVKDRNITCNAQWAILRLSQDGSVADYRKDERGILSVDGKDLV
jgi:hypothetical protein